MGKRRLVHAVKLAPALLCAAALAACAPVGAGATSAPSPPAKPMGKPQLRRGMNLGNALDAPSEGAWGVVLDASDFVSFRQAGFDHVRLPVRFSAHASFGPPYALDADFFARVDWAIGQALANDLAVIVDVHHYDELTKEPEAQRERFCALWRQIAQRYAGASQAVVFELLNEPNGALAAPEWNAILADALRIVRESNPTRLVVLEGVDWASAQSLRDTLAVPEGDPNLVGSFHMYQPILFTHQGAGFMPPEFRTQGVVFPGPPAAPLVPAGSASAVSWVREWFARYDTLPPETNPSGPSTIADQLGMASTFAERRHLPVYMGEFGTIDHADPRSRATWTRATRVEAERRGFGWAYWDDAGGFKAYDRSTRTWVPYLKSALLE